MSELKVDTLTGKTTAGDITVTSEGGAATMQLQQGLCKCWFVSETLANSANTDEDSFNLSSTTDAALGDLRPTYTNIFSNANYSAMGIQHTSANDVTSSKYDPNTSSSTRFLNYEPTSAVYRDACIGGALFGDLA
jgi:hypothetical protein